ncbi:alkaline phosphatase D family protein [Hazenella sp. IB182353]|uniref:alkaline phosphatase D family protein n=1 Tax=Polycladospora coralii TaxID=2771432 RepID=UPI00174719F3|nr:alkaline phosphatase D family protein [Polycladospora coralii]MBS7531237.1 alkaline phosphatase D family protein [Polycladospora coralii]
MPQSNFNHERRIFLKSLLAGSAFLVTHSLGGGLISKVFAESASAIEPSYLPHYPIGEGFSLSVASGDPTSTGAILWTRVDPQVSNGIRLTQFNHDLVEWLDSSTSSLDPAITSFIENGQFVKVEVASDSSFQNVQISGYTPIWEQFDHVVKVDLDGYLDSSKHYYYRFITQSGHVSQTGHFKTLPKENHAIEAVKFAYVSCQDYTNGYYHAFHHIAEEELDFVIHLGDYIYEAVGDPSWQNPLKDRKIKLPSGGFLAQTLADYRTIYRSLRKDINLQKLHENHAMIATWDDHEFADNAYYPAIAPGEDEQSNPTRRFAANQAWFEYIPARVHLDLRKNYTDFQIYRSVKIGNLAEIVLTDQRLYRSSPPCGEDNNFTKGCANIFNPKQSILGEEISGQRTWFLDKMKTSNQTWKIWANAVQFTPLYMLGRYANLDAWDGFSWERDFITKELKDAGIQNWITLTGDLHTFEANLIKQNYKEDKDSEAVGVEFMVGAVTSLNFKEAMYNALSNAMPWSVQARDDVTPQSPETTHSSPLSDEAIKEILKEKNVYQKVAQAQSKSQAINSQKSFSLPGLIDSIIDKILSTDIYHENPWIKCFNSTKHGYCTMTLTADKAVWKAYSVGNIKKEQPQDKETIFKCEVPVNQAKINLK